MKLMLFSILLFSFSAARAESPDELGWVVACEVMTDEADASRNVEELIFCDYSEAGYLWIPDWNSLSGFEGWLLYSGLYNTGEDASRAACRVLWKYPNAYGIHVSKEAGRHTVPPTSQEFRDLLGLTPPTPGTLYLPYTPQGWELQWIYQELEDAEEWEIPEHITLELPGWFIDKWIDSYIGIVELRAHRGSNENIQETFNRVSQFLSETAEHVGALLIESPGEYTLLHRFPNEADREGDADFWIAIRNDSLEYGYKVRTFYGEMPYSWLNIPEEAHDSFISKAFNSYEEAVGYLVDRLSEDGIFERAAPEELSYSLEYMDNLPEDAFRDYCDIAVREVHRPGGRGDPNTAPCIGRFRVYSRAGEILWWQPLFGEFVSYVEILNR